MMDTKKAEMSLVWIFHDEGKPQGVGCLMGEYVLTAAHCIPRAPDAMQPGEDFLMVEVAPLHNPEQRMGLFVVGYEPCVDVALLSTSTLSGTEIPSHEHRQHFTALCLKIEEAGAQLVPDLSDLAPTEETRVHFLNHRGQWAGGRLDVISPDAPRPSVYLDTPGSVSGGTSGTPVFSESGKVLGVISDSQSTGEAAAHSATIAYLKNTLPG